jgi:hypothetical protein
MWMNETTVYRRYLLDYIVQTQLHPAKHVYTCNGSGFHVSKCSDACDLITRNGYSNDTAVYLTLSVGVAYFLSFPRRACGVSLLLEAAPDLVNVQDSSGVPATMILSCYSDSYVQGHPDLYSRRALYGRRHPLY